MMSLSHRLRGTVSLAGRRMTLGLTGMLIGILLVEIAARVMFPQLGLPSFQETGADEDLSLFRSSRILPFEIAPNIPKRTNSLGMRDREYTLKKPKGVFRIVFLGDSVTMCSFYTHRLEKHLLSLSPRRFEVWNCAVSGYGMSEYAIMMEKKVPAYHPDLIVLSLCLNDLASARIAYYDSRGALKYYKALPGIPSQADFFLYKNSYAYRYALSIYDRLISSEERERLAADTALARIVGQAAKIDVPLKAVVFPYLYPKKDEWPDLHPYSLFCSLLERHRVDYLDLSEKLPGSRAECLSLRNSPDDDIHLSRTGDAWAESAIYDYLTEKRLLPL